MKHNEKTVLHSGTHVTSQEIAASLTKDRDDNTRMAVSSPPSSSGSCSTH